MSDTSQDGNSHRSATDRAGARYPVRNRTGYGSHGKPGHSRLELIATTACRTCEAGKGELCRRVDGTDRVQVHKSRWTAFRQI